MAELEEQRPVEPHDSIRELVIARNITIQSTPRLSLPLTHPIRTGENNARTFLSTRQISLRCQQPNGLAVEYHLGRFALLGPDVPATRAPLSHENLQVEGGDQSSSHMPWYIHRNKVAVSRPTLRPTLRFICTAMHHHEAEKLRFFFPPRQHGCVGQTHKPPVCFPVIGGSLSVM